jgi:deoxyribonuclease V
LRQAGLHRWDLTPREAVALQRELARRVLIEPPSARIAGAFGGRRTGSLSVAGADVSCARGSKRMAAAVVVVRVPELELVALERLVTTATFPYVPGLLSFREAPSVLELLGRLDERGVSFDLLMMDGQGLAHPRGLGLASHVGLWLGAPTVGCAKSRLCGEHEEVGPARGDRVPLLLGGRRIGSVLRSRDGVKPLYVSPGHMMDFEGAVRLVELCLSGYRLPEPTRLAHHAAGFRGPGGALAGELETMLERARRRVGRCPL